MVNPAGGTERFFGVAGRWDFACLKVAWVFRSFLDFPARFDRQRGVVLLMPGAMVISFDLELTWGLRKGSDDDFPAIERVREVVDRLLTMFESYGISSTWATVGHLMLSPNHRDQNRLQDVLPAPCYPWFRGRWHDGVPGLEQPRSQQFYAPDIIEKLINCKVYQEIASHTFTHIVVGDPNCNREIATAEFALCQEVAQRWNRRLDSVVFPRNLVGHLEALEDTGYRCYRAMNSEWYWLGPGRFFCSAAPPFFMKPVRVGTMLLRLLDERFMLCPPLPPARLVGRLWEIPHSMFFAPLSGVSKFVPPNHRALKAFKGIRRAAELGRIFGLFTHPHNFLPKPDRLLPAFEAICRRAAEERDAGDLEILTMQEIARRLEDGQNPEWTR